MGTNTSEIPGYTYGNPCVGRSPVTLAELDQLKQSAGLTDGDAQALKMAGDVLSDQVTRIVKHWRTEIIGGIPHLARHTRSPDGSLLPPYVVASGLRFEQWILDTCRRPYDQAWLDYQHEIALRHTTLKKNQIDHVDSTPYVPLRDIITFTTVMNETMKPYLAAKGHSPADVDFMHAAWCKSIQIQIALWTRLYVGLGEQW